MEFIQNLGQAYDLLDTQLVDQQVALELESVTLGRERFLKNYQAAIEQGEVISNPVGKKLTEVLIKRMVEGIHAYLEKHSGKAHKLPKALPYIKQMDAEKLAYITIKTVLSGLVKAKGDLPFIQTVQRLNRNVFLELKYSAVREQEIGLFKAYLDDGIKKRVGASYKELYARNVLANNDIKVEVYTQEEQQEGVNIYVGVALLEILIESTGLLQYQSEVKKRSRGKTLEQMSLSIAPEYVNALNDRAEELADYAVLHMPMVIPPRAWTGIDKGGYYTLSKAIIPFVRARTKAAIKRFKYVEMPLVYQAVNIAQNTAWKINTKVLDVINAVKNERDPIGCIPTAHLGEPPEKPFDIDTNEQALKEWKEKAVEFYKFRDTNISRRLRMESTLHIAEKFAEFERIYFPYNLDWRGRVYAIPSFNPQGDDIMKGCLILADGKPIGATGFKWLKVHGANCAGVDKVTFEERIEWVENNHVNIMESAQDPVNYRWWSEQESPFQFLAFCFEYANVVTQGLDYVCSLQVAFDGSCSGTQHFSAMLRDEVGGKAVNLVPSDKVQDIYKMVADVVNTMCEEMAENGSDDELEAHTDEESGEITERIILGDKSLAREWLAFGITRSVTKRPVMTLSYGATKFGFRDQILEDTIKPAMLSGKPFRNPNKSATFMADLVWKAVAQVVVKAVEAMHWLQKGAKLVTKEVKDKQTGEVLRKSCAVSWTTPDYFPVWQEYFKQKTSRLDTMFLGSFRITPSYLRGTNEIDSRKQEAGIAPNFVHSQDANHLRAVIRWGFEKYNIQSFALIHDSFGTIPADSDKMFRCIRESMVDIYTNNNVLESFRNEVEEQLHISQVEDLPRVPKFGKLDLKDILKSQFAFA
ncbi:DNA-directed RNA polymerase [Pasteurella phage vB_PmuP_PS07]|uniref:DNA-directed RNA polymerase n=1 Tax=Pasteurella phage vB_PmuP_Pa7 TaxID=2767198 RepID=A0A7G8ZYP1_9CAUD|nr:DNA-directed RNA polymerase [Pasteurella phage vB_PmuP_Pa7]UIS73862.1 DNA-directed RNA polymerase [Pasteurella phage vB_PmuP_PS07]UIS74020.1 DNA-directed RNA polymerase [Pasteurella phage vB_PmuP_PS30]